MAGGVSMKMCQCSLPLQALLVLSAAAAVADEGRPLCHSNFRALESCLSNNYDLLRTDCAAVYGKLQACLDRDWRYTDAAQGYARREKSFNRLKLCRHGLMLYNPMDWYIGRSLEVYGEWGEKKVEIWSKIVKAGHVALDVGAHVGTLTLPLSNLVGQTGRVIAYEPFYPSFAALASNAGLNSLENVEVRQAVVADRHGKVLMNRGTLAFNRRDFFNFGSMNYDGLRIYNATEDVERPSTADWDEYPVVPLDHLSVSQLDFIKIDAEAMELAVLQGAQRLLRKFKPVLFLEYRNPTQKDPRLLNFLRKKMKYECVLLRIPIFNERNFREENEDIWGDKGKIVNFNLLCKHRWWDYKDMDEQVVELFTSAVDTDVEGLRTTPTPDPFEIMKRASRASADAQVAGRLTAQPPATERKQGKGFEDMTLDELLDDAGPADTSGSQDISLDDLLHPSRAPSTAPRAKPERTAAAKATSGGKGSGTGGGRSNQPKAAPAEPSLDELLSEPAGESSADASGPGGRKGKASVKASGGKASSGAAGVGRSSPGSKKGKASGEVNSGKSSAGKPPAAKRVEEMSLDELLAFDEDPASAQTSQAAPDDTELSLDELLEPAAQDRTPAQPAGFEDMSLDELLSFEEEVPSKPPVKVAVKVPAQQSSGKKGGSAASKVSASTPHEVVEQKPQVVQVNYDPEPTLDEL